tara:strand:+ start:529 stop:735 length:207 start_codon:yes stop_codon:yes gene_type:complete
MSSVESKVISDRVYDPLTRSLVLTFQNGKKFKYSGVPSEINDAFEGAPSAGGFFHAQIKSMYGAEEVT